jgi:predicted SnoaL-like aldol condensation-catalyzing enzyme
MSKLERNKKAVVADDGRIVEHWDLLQVMPKQSASPNRMF